MLWKYWLPIEHNGWLSCVAAAAAVAVDNQEHGLKDVNYTFMKLKISVMDKYHLPWSSLCAV